LPVAENFRWLFCMFNYSLFSNLARYLERS
jgi:hypothetical protein